MPSVEISRPSQTRMGVHFSSVHDNWRTPGEFYDGLNGEFGFKDDPCPIGGTGGLERGWAGPAFCNPPYSQISTWLAKGWAEWQKGTTVVFLIPSRTDTRWWHQYVMKASEIRFIRGRLHFNGAKSPAPFPSCVVVFRA